MHGSLVSASIASSIPSWLKNYPACNTANSRKDGTANCPSFLQTRKAGDSRFFG